MTDTTSGQAATKKHRVGIYGWMWMYTIRCLTCKWEVGGMGSMEQAEDIKQHHKRNPRWKPVLP